MNISVQIWSEVDEVLKEITRMVIRVRHDAHLSMVRLEIAVVSSDSCQVAHSFDFQIVGFVRRRSKELKTQ